jgi:glycosyltransferase involved in cell wall biosynthesis
LKLLHVIGSIDPRGGGPIEGVKQMARANIANGHVVHVASLDDPGAPWVRSCPIPCFAFGPTALKYGYTRRLIPWLRAHAEDYDAVIVNGIWQFHTLAVREVFHRTATPYFVFTHGMLDPYFKRRYPFKHLKKWLYWQIFEYRVLRDASAVLFTCEEERRLASETFWLYKARELVVNYGVAAPPKDDTDVQRDAFFNRFPHLVGQRIMLSLGRVHPKKGLDLTVKAFARTLGSSTGDDPPTHLVIAGPEIPEHGAALRKLSSDLGIVDRVTFTGMLEGLDKWGAFRAADVFILTSHQENFGIAVVEALACGLPVLISDQVNIWREIEEDGAGIVEPATEQGACSLMLRWIESTHLERDAMRAAATALFHRCFRVERAAESLISATWAFRERLKHGIHG